ncbi:MAG: hypothetical protein IJH34_02135 [Romboutsia sp.]|nr:hypothetical protein [Romboutsia sp.]
MNKVIENAYKIADKNQVILKGNIKISRDINCLIFAHYCDSTLFYKRFFKISKDVFKVNHISRKNLKQVKKLLKSLGYKKIWSKGVFSIYGDLRPLAVKAGFGQWGHDGIVENEKYGSNFLVSAIFYK